MLMPNVCGTRARSMWHECFGEYLHRIGAEETPACQECCAEVDSAQHVLEVCPRFQEQWQVLKDTVGNDASLTVIVRVLVEEERGRITRFCEEVMATKEITERSRETCDPARRERRRAKVRTGRRARGNTAPTRIKGKTPLSPLNHWSRRWKQ